ncbi:MAG: hypothetical protein HY293_11160 [Planctomycetes bacterium]|nr:hypothetical protein [Planctomycetota bacterium]
MRKILVVLLACQAGCWYDRPNPWRTESDRERYLDKKEQDWQLELKQPYDLPQNAGVAMTLPDLEAFRDTVLVNADASTLLRMRDQSVQKAAGLQTSAQSMAPLNESNKVPIYELLWEIRVEKLRLQMIEDRLSSAR